MRKGLFPIQNRRAYLLRMIRFESEYKPPPGHFDGTAQKRIDQMGFPALIGPRADLGWKVTQNINTSPFRLCYSMIVQLC